MPSRMRDRERAPLDDDFGAGRMGLVDDRRVLRLKDAEIEK